jgi:hypothetical protein
MSVTLHSGVAHPLAPFHFGVTGSTYQNMARWTEDVTNAVWSKSIGGTGVAPVTTANYAAAPDGTQTATRVQLSIVAGTLAADICRVYQTITVTSGKPYTQSIWLKSTDGATSYTVLFRDDFANIGNVNITITGAWQKFTFSLAAATGTCNSGSIWLRGNAGTAKTADVLMWGLQVNQSLLPFPYVKATTAAIGPSGL